MHRILALVGLTLVASPAVSEHSAERLFDRAERELAALDRDVDRVRHPHLRDTLERRVERLDRLLVRLERSMVFLPPEVQPPPHHPPAPPAWGLTFDEAMGMVQMETFDRGKLDAIRRVARNGRFTTDEARALAAQMTFDSGRADALIALHPAVVDPHRFGLALDILTFGSSRRKVAQAVNL